MSERVTYTFKIPASEWLDMTRVSGGPTWLRQVQAQTMRATDIVKGFTERVKDWSDKNPDATFEFAEMQDVDPILGDVFIPGETRVRDWTLTGTFRDEAQAVMFRMTFSDMITHPVRAGVMSPQIMAKVG